MLSAGSSPPRARHVWRTSTPNETTAAIATPAYVITCGAIQNESRPITMCHRMSQPTPMPATALATSRAQSAPRDRDLNLDVPWPSNVGALRPPEQVVQRAGVQHLRGADPCAPG